MASCLRYSVTRYSFFCIYINKLNITLKINNIIIYKTVTKLYKIKFLASLLLYFTIKYTKIDSILKFSELCYI